MATWAARAAGTLVRERVHAIGEVRHKGATDLVTDVDEASERLVRTAILGHFPSHTILGEEGGTSGGSDRHFRWIVDPLDGTTNFANGLPMFCVSIGLEVRGTLALGVIYDPNLDELFVAERGHGATLNGAPIRVSEQSNLSQALLATGFPYERQHFQRAMRAFEGLSLASIAVRRLGSAALDLCYVAAGRFGGYWEFIVRPWDIAAGALLVEEAGGRVTAIDGSPFDVEGGDILATNGYVHDAMAEELRHYR